MSMRVATFAASDRLLGAAMTTQARLARQRESQASGLVSADYGGLGSQAQRLVSLESAMVSSKAYSDAADEAVARIEEMHNVLSSITDVVSSARSALMTGWETDSADNASLQASAKAYMEEIAGLLNTQYQGRYLFSGTATATAPVDLTALSATPDLSTPDASYFAGNRETFSVRVSMTQDVTYAASAGDAAVEKLFRALGVVAAGGTDGASIQSASALLLEGLDGVIGLQSGLGLTAATLERASASQADFRSYGETLVADIKEVDIAAVAAEISSYEAQVQASYAALGRLQSLSLVNYLS